MKKNLVLTLCAAFLAFSASAQTVMFRGDNHCGIFTQEQNLLKEWPEGGPEKMWVVNNAGKGHSSAIVEGGRIYTAGLTEDEQNEKLSCYTLDGTLVYQVTYGRAWTKSYQETRCSPLIDGDRIYIISGMGELVCLNKADGKILWSVDYWQKYGLTPSDQGISDQPLLDGDNVIINAAGKEVCLVAYNKMTGDVVWETPSFGDKSMYVPCIMIEWKGKRQIIGAIEEHVFGVDPKTGKMVWNDSKWIPDPENKKWSNAMVNTPVFYEGYLFVSLGDGHGCTLYKMADDLSSVTFQWKKGDVDMYMGGMILVDGIVYGSTGNKNKWAAIDIKAGEVRYHDTWQGKARGALICADNMFYMFDERRGFMALARINPEHLDIVSEFRVTDGAGACFSHPSIYDGVLYVRHGEALVAYKVRNS